MSDSTDWRRNVRLPLWLRSRFLVVAMVVTNCRYDVYDLSSTGVVMATEGESRDYCQLEMFYAACGGTSPSDDVESSSDAGHPHQHQQQQQQHHQQVRVISMRSARYGRMRVDGRCVKRDYGYIGCASDVLGHVDRLCSGRRVCDFAVAELHGNQPCPNDLTPYLEAAFDCLPVITEPTQRCAIDGSRTPIVIRSRSSGYLASSITMDTGRGGPSCPWNIEVPAGQTINITLVNFARVGLPTDWSSSSAVATSAQVSSSSSSSAAAAAAQPAGPLHSVQEGTPVSSSVVSGGRPKTCYQLADIRESLPSQTGPSGDTVRTVTECEGSPRLSHVYTSTGNSILIDIIVAKILNVHFLLHFKGCANPPVPPGATLRREGDEAWIKCNVSGDLQWRLRCVGSEWRETRHNVATPGGVNCTPHGHVTSSASVSFSDGTSGPGGGGALIWDVGQLFAADAFPLSILLVVAVGVAMGVFVGGVLLVCAARYVRRRRRQQTTEDEEDDYSLTHQLHHHHHHHPFPQPLACQQHQSGLLLPIATTASTYRQLSCKSAGPNNSSATTGLSASGEPLIAPSETATTAQIMSPSPTSDLRDQRQSTALGECFYCTTGGAASTLQRRTGGGGGGTGSPRLSCSTRCGPATTDDIAVDGGKLPRGCSSTACGRCANRYRTETYSSRRSLITSDEQPQLQMDAVQTTST